ncbi:MAG: ABC transporter permease [Candidatus Marinimicrobia bacterium]|nr:ABC transporter permease [Candidatus Neomarinimicrobiota bacterium]
MKRFILSRVFYSILTLWILTVIIFSMVRLTGDPAELLGDYPGAPEADLEAIRERWGLNESWPTQYRKFVTNVFQGDFGRSFQFGTSVTDIYFSRLPNSLQLAAAAFIISIVIGVPLGIISAVKLDSGWDNFGKLVALLGLSIPGFFVGLVLILIFGVQLDWLPVIGKGEHFWDVKYLVMPAFALGWYFAGSMLRLTRSSMLEVLGSDYVKLARLKGVPEWVVISKHAFKNAMIPIVTLAGLQLVLMINVAVVIEVIFQWPGVGLLILDGLLGRDFPVVQGSLLMAGAMIVGVNLLLDILYAYVDPRIRLAR